MPTNEHLLAIGTTGMLAAATRALASSSQLVSVVARRPTALAGELGATPIAADWSDAAFPDAVLVALADGPPIGLCVAWVHSDGMDALHALLARLPWADDGRLVHVLGSVATFSPQQRAERTRAFLPAFVRYRYVALGHVDGPSGRRWLTHDEISAAVVRAVREDADVVAGSLD